MPRLITVPADSYPSFSDLARNQIRGVDYEIEVCHRPFSDVAVIAPHGGGIEPRTSNIARAIAGEELSLYLFEGIKLSGNYPALHLTSHRFDEPSCLKLLSQCSFIVAIHGCSGDGEKVLLGGLDHSLKLKFADALRQARVTVETDAHLFPATDPNNICNRGKSKKGVQLELTGPLRGSVAEARVVQAVRSILLSLDTVA